MELVPDILDRLSESERADLRAGGILLIAHLPLNGHLFHLVIDKEMGPPMELKTGEIIIDLYDPLRFKGHQYHKYLTEDKF